MTDILMIVYDWLSPSWMELCFALFFVLGFAYMRVSSHRKFSSKPRKLSDDMIGRPQTQLHKSLDAELSAGRPATALKIWRAGSRRTPTPLETLKIVTHAFLEADPDNLVQEILQHVQAHKDVLCRSRTVTAVLDVVARAGHVAIMEEFAECAQKLQDLQITPSSQTYEVLLGGHAAVGDVARVKTLFAEARAMNLKITPRAFALTINGFLKKSMSDAALQQILDMHDAGYSVPSFALTQLFRAACEEGHCRKIFDRIFPVMPVPPDAVVLMMEDAYKRNDLQFALRVERAARDSNVPLLAGAYESSLRLCAVNSDLHALHLWEELQKSGLRISDGLCIGLLARCAESKFLSFAESIVHFLRSRDSMTIGAYSCLMKCYAYCGMYDKACDLYDQIRASRLEPDAKMYGCLMRFAVECGRTDLSRELFDKTPSLDIQNYMSLIQSAGREKDVDRAFSLLEHLVASGVVVDIATYSCVLDACVSAGDMGQARTLVEQMKKTFGKLDMITFNTLLKGYCYLGDISAAKALLEEMTSLGFPPNDVSFNCLINAAVSTGDLAEAWRTVDMMEKHGVSIDHYTLSIMMKSLKRGKNMRCVNQVFDLLDRAGIDVFSDEVLLNTVLEACIRHSQFHRLEAILQGLPAANLRPSVHTYCSLIRAGSALKLVDRCWELWQFIVEHRGMQPNDLLLGCMLDALVRNDKVDDAVALFGKWKDTVPPNTVMYATIIKGFANKHQADRAMAMWREMRQFGLPLNNIVYHSLIDSQARVGAMDQVSELVEDMVSNGCAVDLVSYSTIVKGYCVKGDLDKAFEVFRGMQANSMEVNSIIYNAILDGCTKNNRMDLADLVIHDMVKYDVKPSNYTLGILVKMYGRRGEVNKAFEVVDTHMQKHGVQPNLQVRTCLMCACVYNHDFERAYAVFEDLKAAGQGADSKAYSALISGIVRNGRGRLPEAVELVKEAYGLKEELVDGRGASSAPGVQTEALEQLLRALGAKGLMESLGLPLIDQLRAAKVPISGRLLSSFIGG